MLPRLRQGRRTPIRRPLERKKVQPQGKFRAAREAFRKKALQSVRKARTHVRTKTAQKVERAKARVKTIDMPLSKMLPNIVTLGALAAGFSAFRFAYIGEINFAVLCILIAALLDGVDGRLARLLNASSEFGAQLDSLSDFACFGVTPAIVVYVAYFQSFETAGWMLCLFFIFCQALRLARFNSQLHTRKMKLPDNFFIGVPAPLGAVLALFPTVVGFAFDFKLSAYIHGAFLVLSGGLMISRLPTYSLKSVKVPPHLRLPLLMGVGLGCTAFAAAPWTSLMLTTVGYLVMLPLSYRDFCNRRASLKLHHRPKNIKNLS